MSPRLPDGEPAPRGRRACPPRPWTALGTRPFGVYLHVPFCASRCGYCDFNTYVPGEGVARDGFADAVLAEWRLADRVLGGAPRGGDGVRSAAARPRCCRSDELARLIDAIPRAPGAEVTVEANPETIDAARLRALRRAGVTRLSLGMQSAAPGVLATLERAHTPGGAVAAARLARDAGLAHVSLDLIYGTPGERDEDWAASLAAVLDAGVDHVSAYPLVVEPGTRLHARVRAGALPPPDADDAGAPLPPGRRRARGGGARVVRGLQLGGGARARGRRTTSATGARTTGGGSGPARTRTSAACAGGTCCTPRATPARSPTGASPAAGREVLTAAQRRTERTLLGVRLAEGLALEEPAPAAPLLADAGCSTGAALARGVARLTLEGRLSADRVARELLG